MKLTTNRPITNVKNAGKIHIIITSILKLEKNYFRLKLFSSNQIVSHKKETSNNNDQLCNQELYIENLNWFSNKIEEIKGKVIQIK